MHLCLPDFPSSLDSASIIKYSYRSDTWGERLPGAALISDDVNFRQSWAMVATIL